MFGAVLGHHPKSCRPEEHEAETLRRMLWGGVFQSDATDYGSIMEHAAFCITEIALIRHYAQMGYSHVWLEETGTQICLEHPWLSASSDGLIFATAAVPNCGGACGAVPPPIRGTLEIKCPYYRDEWYPVVPPYYYDQFMGAAAILGVEHIVFAVYLPDATQINYFRFHQRYWEQDMFPRLRAWYMGRFAPRAILRDRGVIQPGHVDPPPTLAAGARLRAYCFPPADAAAPPEQHPPARQAGPSPPADAAQPLPPLPRGPEDDLHEQEAQADADAAAAEQSPDMLWQRILSRLPVARLADLCPLTEEDLMPAPAPPSGAHTEWLSPPEDIECEPASAPMLRRPAKRRRFSPPHAGQPVGEEAGAASPCSDRAADDFALSSRLTADPASPPVANSDLKNDAVTDYASIDADIACISLSSGWITVCKRARGNTHVTT
jgi:hypothetical protein